LKILSYFKFCKFWRIYFTRCCQVWRSCVYHWWKRHTW